MSRREAAWAAVLTVCLIALLAASGSASGGAGRTDDDRLPAALAALAGLVGALSCLTLARRRIPAASRAALIGLATGVTYAATAALIKAATDVFATGGLLAVLASRQLYAVVVLGTAGLLLAQLAFQAGRLTASLPAMSTVDRAEPVEQPASLDRTPRPEKLSCVSAGRGGHPTPRSRPAGRGPLWPAIAFDSHADMSWFRTGKCVGSSEGRADAVHRGECCERSGQQA